MSSLSLAEGTDVFMGKNENGKAREHSSCLKKKQLNNVALRLGRFRNTG